MLKICAHILLESDFEYKKLLVVQLIKIWEVVLKTLEGHTDEVYDAIQLKK
jgi:hypothetical protein